jgi:hypothetical protein
MVYSPPQLDSDSLSLIDNPHSVSSPERKLCLAVLERAILDFVGNDTKERLGAEEWLFDEADDSLKEEVPCYEEPVLSFQWVCETLGLEASKIRSIIYNMPRRGANKVAPWYTMKHPIKAASAIAA